MQTFVFFSIVSSEIMHQRQRVSDLEEEIELLHKQLRNTQLKVVEQVKEFIKFNRVKNVLYSHKKLEI